MSRRSLCDPPGTGSGHFPGRGVSVGNLGPNFLMVRKIPEANFLKREGSPQLPGREFCTALCVKWDWRAWAE